MKTTLFTFLLFLSTLQAQSPKWSLYYSGNNSKIFSLAQNYDHSIWFGNSQGQIGKVNSTSNQTYQLPTAFPIWSIDCDQENNIWIATQDTGLVKFDSSDFTFINMRTIITRTPQFNNANCVKVDNQNNILVGSIAGLAIFDGNNWIVFDDTNSPLQYWPEIKSINIDFENNIWFAFYFGAGKFDRILNWQFWNDLEFLSTCDVESEGTGWFVNEFGNAAIRVNGDSSWITTEVSCNPSSVYQFAIDSFNVKWFSNFGGGEKVFVYDDQDFVELIFPPYAEIQNSIVSAVYIDSRNNKWFGFDNGYIVKYTGDFPSDIDEENDIFVSDFRLSQNYPNPFNPSTVISWQSPVGSWQTLKVYDVLGNEIMILVNENKPAGKYEIEFNASSLPSGVYFYQLHAGNFVETKKMILLR